MTEAKCIRENEDGSAVYEFVLTDEERDILLRLGIVTAIKNGIQEAKQYHPEYKGSE
jgi:hypothetical protein